MKIMGIINITPNSFFAGSRRMNVEDAVEQARKMKADGADILDIGGESTRPGIDPVAPEEEVERIVPV
ncbi:MAG: dihydropteroate synthase, partial [Gallicola sp.]|nr:dihydropteroate synthase [Gallicola sp.]